MSEFNEELQQANMENAELEAQRAAELIEREAGARLPQLAGLSEEHMTVTDRFIRKIVKTLQNETLHIKNYGVSKNYYDGMDETLQIGLDDGAQVTLTFSGRK